MIYAQSCLIMISSSLSLIIQEAAGRDQKPFGNFIKPPERLNRPLGRPQTAQLTTPGPGWIVLQSRNCSAFKSFVYPNQTAFITSPGYPGKYPGGLHCSVSMELQNTDQKLEIGFLAVDLEHNHDWIKITSGEEQRIVTGNKVPSAFVTPLHKARMVIHSDEDVQGTGFVIKITTKTLDAISIEGRKGPANEVCPKTFKLKTGLNGTISSPGYDSRKYSGNLTCKWLIKGPSKSMIQINISRNDFALELSNDQLQLIGLHGEGPPPHLQLTESNSELLASLSGQLETDFSAIYPFPVMAVQFSSDESISDRGFKLSYQIIPQSNKTIVLNASAGLIQSAGYPVDYAANLQQTWIIKAAVHGVQLRLVDLQLDTANNDHVSIGTGRNVGQNLISVLKGSLPDIPADAAVIQVLNATELYVHFVSNFHKERRRGWIISYEPIPNAAGQRTAIGIPKTAALLFDEKKLHTDVPESDHGTHRQNDNHRLIKQTLDSHLDFEELISSSYAVRGAGVYPEFSGRIMEIEVEPLTLKQNWQQDLQECLRSMFPRGSSRLQRAPTFKTTMVHTTDNAVIRVVITSTDSASSGTDILSQLKSTLSSTGRIRCNDSLEMYLPDMVHQAADTVNGLNWLLVSISIVAFFLIIFSIFLFIHCRKRRRIIRKIKEAAITPSPTQANFDIVMEPAMQKNPLYQIKKLEGSMGRSGVPRYFLSEPVTYQPELGDLEKKEPNTKMCPSLSRTSALGNTVINQSIPTITDACSRQLGVILEPIEEDAQSGATSEMSIEYHEQEQGVGEEVEVCDALSADAYAAFMNEWRNGRPMTVRAVKQKNLLKKQIKKEMFDEPVENNPTSV